ncbi:MAG: DedA family protein [bacterium]|nr:DedA family protein [bacterium]
MFELDNFIKTIGYAGIFAIVFAESGLLLGVFLPGDSLLFTAGFLASQGFFEITTLCFITFIAAVLGDNVGYHFGKKAGPRIFKKEESLFFNPKNIDRSRSFYEKHGGKTIIIARFLPVIRTFAPIIAGVGKMQYRRFLIFNLSGAFLWAVGVTLLGYFLGKSIPNIDRYLLPIVVIIITISIAPTLFHLVKDQERRADIIGKIKKIKKTK